MTKMKIDLAQVDFELMIKELKVKKPVDYNDFLKIVFINTGVSGSTDMARIIVMLCHLDEEIKKMALSYNFNNALKDKIYPAIIFTNQLSDSGFAECSGVTATINNLSDRLKHLKI